MDAKQLSNFLEKTDLDFAVTSADEVPRYPIQKPTGLIVNTDPSYRSGKHWVCIYLPKKGPTEFFDSLGRSPEYYHPDFRRVLITNGPTYLHNEGRLQDYGSPYCGEYCLDFLVQRHRGESYQSFLKQFGDHYAENDSRVLHNLRERVV